MKDLIKKGSHMVLLYRDEDNIIGTISKFIKNSLIQNLKCLYISGDLNTNNLKHKLRKSFRIDKYIANGQVYFLKKTDAYSKDGEFIADKMIKLLKEESKQAIKEGFDGLAITGEISWVLNYGDGIERIIEYEWKLNKYIFDKHPVAALCRYNVEKFKNDHIVNIIQLHPYLIYQNNIYENPYYLPFEAYESDQISKYQIETWLKNISFFNTEKSRLLDEIDQTKEKYNELQLNMTHELVLSMIKLLEQHDIYTKGHSRNVARLSKLFAIYLGKDKEFIDKIYYVGLVHDIGKTIIPKRILNKKGKLTKEEFEFVKKHPEIGYESLKNSEIVREVAKDVLHHHEKFDGNGYPEGLKGEDIPLGSRIITIVDAYDAMIHDRPYRNALSNKEAIEELVKNKDIQFDPNLVDEFIEMLENIDEIKKHII